MDSDWAMLPNPRLRSARALGTDPADPRPPGRAALRYEHASLALGPPHPPPILGLQPAPTVP